MYNGRFYRIKAISSRQPFDGQESKKKVYAPDFSLTQKN
jgi:hypothetical protein